MAFRGAGFDPRTGLSGDRIATEGPEPSDNPSIDVLAGLGGEPPPAGGWLLRTCSKFEDIQLETVTSQQQRVFPTTASQFQKGGVVCDGRRRWMTTGVTL